MSDDLTTPAVLCMASTGPDRDLDQAIDRAMGNTCAEGWEHRIPEYTASLDAAMTLVPDNMGVSVSRHGKRNDDCSAYVGKSDSDARGNFMTDTSTADAKTMALAVCAAALKARHKLLNPATTKSRKKSVRNAKATDS